MIGDHWDSGGSDAVLIEDAPGDGALVIQAYLGEQVGLRRDGNRAASSDGEPLPVGGGEVSGAGGGENVHPGRNARKHEVAASTGACGETHAFGGSRLWDWIQALEGARERASGRLFEHNPLYGPGGGAGGHPQDEQEAVHIELCSWLL